MVDRGTERVWIAKGVIHGAFAYATYPFAPFGNFQSVYTHLLGVASPCHFPYELVCSTVATCGAVPSVRTQGGIELLPAVEAFAG